MHFGFSFHVLAVDFVIITENAPRFGAKHNTTPSRNERLMTIAYKNRRLSVACSSSHIGAQTLVSKIEGRRCALPRGPSIESAAHVVDMSRRVKPKAQNQNRQSQICRSLTPLKSAPSAPAHSARPRKNDPRADFVIFKNQ